MSLSADDRTKIRDLLGELARLDREREEVLRRIRHVVGEPNRVIHLRERFGVKPEAHS